jgi:hypothetical protein
MRNVTIPYVRAKMELLQVSFNEAGKDLNIKPTDIGWMLSGAKPLSKVLKAMFYYYLKTKEQEMCLKWNVPAEQLEQILSYNLSKANGAG